VLLPRPALKSSSSEVVDIEKQKREELVYGNLTHSPLLCNVSLYRTVDGQRQTQLNPRSARSFLVFFCCFAFLFFFTLDALDLLRHLGLLEVLRQVAGLLRVPVYRTRWLAIAVARNHEALPAEHPQEQVQRRGGDVVLAAKLDGTVHHPLNVDETANREGAVVGSEETLRTGGGGDVLQLWRVVQLTAAEAYRGTAEERRLSAAQHNAAWLGERHKQKARKGRATKARPQ
jgi:hypothetical protein